MRASPIVLAVLIAGCGYSEDKFYTKYNETYCGLVIACGKGELSGWSTEKDCVSALEAVQEITGDDCVEYDPQLGRQCVKGVGAMTCDDLTVGTNYPEACTQVCGSADTGA